MDYQSSLHYLYSLTDYGQDRIARYDPDTLSLGRIRRVLARLGNPQERFQSVHVAGTKGKGSVAATCASVLQSAGFCTGLYTSPHLHTFRERIRINGEFISRDAVAARLQHCLPIFEQEPELTTFEAITALAFVYFAQSGVDLAVLEVGLGGRLDATNVVTPLVSVITSLSFDHTYLLGHTLAEIAYEKGGIIKPNRPTVSEPQESEALQVIQNICTERASPLTVVGQDWVWERKGLSPDLSGQSFELHHTGRASLFDDDYTITLLGSHQIRNAVAAIAALDVLEQSSIPIQPHHVRQGLADTRWPGRFEILQRDPPLVLDCAHNGDSMHKLVAALSDVFGPERRWTFIIGVSRDKDIEGMLHAMAPNTNRLLVSKSRHLRAMAPDEIAILTKNVWDAAGIPRPEIITVGDVGAALDQARACGDAPICVTGSIFVVADAREAWALYTGNNLPETDDGVASGLSALHPVSSPLQAVTPARSE